MMIQRDHKVNSEGGLVDDEQVNFPTKDKGDAQAPEQLEINKAYDGFIYSLGSNDQNPCSEDGYRGSIPPAELH